MPCNLVFNEQTVQKNATVITGVNKYIHFQIMSSAVVNDKVNRIMSCLIVLKKEFIDTT